MNNFPVGFRNLRALLIISPLFLRSPTKFKTKLKQTTSNFSSSDLGRGNWKKSYRATVDSSMGLMSMYVADIQSVYLAYDFPSMAPTSNSLIFFALMIASTGGSSCRNSSSQTQFDQRFGAPFPSLTPLLDGAPHLGGRLISFQAAEVFLLED